MVNEPARLRLTTESGQYLEDWLETASAEDVEDAAACLSAVTDLSALGTYQHLDDTTDPRRFHLLARPEPDALVITIRLLFEDQRFQIIRIGPLP